MIDAGAFARTIAESLSPSVITSDIRQTARQARREAQHFARVLNAQSIYQAQLRRVARQVGEIINAYPIGDPAALAELQSLLQQYAQILRPWAFAAAQRMIAEVLRRDETAWMRHAAMIGVELKREILGATPLGDVMRRLVEDQSRADHQHPDRRRSRCPGQEPGILDGWHPLRRIAFLRPLALASDV